jgi:hypothetical protein
VSELLGVAQQTARGMLEAEDNIRLLREQFEQTQELEARGELAAHALDQVEVQLRLMRERRKAWTASKASCGRGEIASSGFSYTRGERPGGARGAILQG